MRAGRVPSPRIGAGQGPGAREKARGGQEAGARATIRPMKQKSVPCLGPAGFHRMAYTEWGAEHGPDAQATICVHGLTRHGRDFDDLARALSADRRVACPDVVGRGSSDWLADEKGYTYPQYVADMAMLIARLGTKTVDWVGTSMGGLIGMSLCANAGAPVRRMVLNDIGPLLPKAALDRIAAYVGVEFTFPDFAAVLEHVKQGYAPFGPLTEDQWRVMAQNSVVPDGKGGFKLHYDPKIAYHVKKATGADIDLWALWERVRCPVLVLRGATSDLFLAETAAEMVARGKKGKGPPTEVVEFPVTGHAPALVAADQIAAVKDWLDAA